MSSPPVILGAGDVSSCQVSCTDHPATAWPLLSGFPTWQETPPPNSGGPQPLSKQEVPEGGGWPSLFGDVPRWLRASCPERNSEVSC